jgi:Protein of unknown function (DUF3047)
MTVGRGFAFGGGGRSLCDTSAFYLCESCLLNNPSTVCSHNHPIVGYPKTTMKTYLHFVSRAALLTVLSVLWGCATSPLNTGDSVSHASSKVIPSLTETERLIGSPKGWRALRFPTKRETQYSLVNIDGRPALRSQSNASASSLAAELDIDLKPSDQLTWSWRIENLIADADTSVKHLEDSPARIVLAFDGDLASLSIKEQLFNERATLLTGRKFPFATLMYVCDTKKMVGEIITNPHSSTVKKSPGKLIGIAVMNDTDNTGAQATTFFGDLKLQTIKVIKN